ncbi:MAG: AMIN domain-containing protein, partial [Chitinophagaceae bacterium]
MKRIFFAALCLGAACSSVHAQTRPFIRLQEPTRDINRVFSSIHYMVGSTCKGCSLKLNGQPVKVYATGAFALEVDLVPGDTTFLLTSIYHHELAKTKNLFYHYILPPAPAPDSVFSISSIRTFPEGNLILAPGDRIRIRIKALPGCKASWLNHRPLFELPLDQTDSMPGIYQGEYQVQKDDPLIQGHLPVYLEDPAGKTLSSETIYQFSTWKDMDHELVGETISPLSYMEFGLGGDRLGGAKMGYLDTLVRMQIIGQFNDKYQVRLCRDHDAFVPAQEIRLLAPGTFLPRSLTSSFRVWGGDHADYVSVGLTQRLPYQAIQEINPDRILVNIFGATANTNWITQLMSAKEIKNVYYLQKENQVVQVVIDLKDDQCWGYHLFYQG